MAGGPGGKKEHPAHPKAPFKGLLRVAPEHVPNGSCSTSSPQRGAAELGLKHALHLSAALPYTSMGREAALGTSCSCAGGTACCPGRRTSLGHPPATAPHPGLCTETFGIAQSIPAPAVCPVATAHPPGHSRCQRCGLVQHCPHTKSICQPLCNASTTIS